MTVEKLHELDFYNFYVQDNVCSEEKDYDIVVEKINESELLIKSFKSAKIHDKIDSYFAFRPEGYRFVPSYRNGYWDGYIRVYKKSKQRLPTGLIYPLIHFAYCRAYKILIKYPFYSKKLQEAKVAEFIEKLKIDASKVIRDYQFQAVYDALRNRRMVVQIVTSGGKSLVIYCLARYCVATNRKLLIVVPKIALVQQLFKDFFEYGWEEVDLFVQKRYGGESKSLDKPIIISSWQSIYKNTEDLKDFKAIIVDECHESKAKSLVSLMSNSTNAELRIGFTGTMPLDENKADWFTIVGNIGLPKMYANYESLFQNNFASKIKVVMKIFDYELEMKKDIYSRVGKNYSEEMLALIENEERTKEIVKIVTEEAIGNSLILFFRKEHGNRIFEQIQEKYKGTNRKVFYVDGSTSVDDRERIRIIAEKNDNIDIVASIQIFSTGINITNLHNLIFAHFTKSYYKVLQSVGRVMRKHPKKEFATIYDIVDNLSHQDQFGNVFKNYAVVHAKTRKSYYEMEKYEVVKEIVRISRLPSILF